VRGLEIRLYAVAVGVAYAMKQEPKSYISLILRPHISAYLIKVTCLAKAIYGWQFILHFKINKPDYGFYMLSICN
jgi:hypothetical protein